MKVERPKSQSALFPSVQELQEALRKALTPLGCRVVAGSHELDPYRYLCPEIWLLEYDRK